MEPEVVGRMRGKTPGVRVIDLFCGAGGFSEGFHQSGFDVVYGIDFWPPACETHTLNGLGVTEKTDLLKADVDEILEVKRRLEGEHGTIDVVIGSPPCTEFSFAKNGGRGDIEKGMLLVRKHLAFVSIFRPKYWLMENVPRLEQVLDKECDRSPLGGWTISYEQLGIPKSRWHELGLEGDCLHIPHGKVFTASDHGAHENRRRFITGDFPCASMDGLKVDAHQDVSLGGLLTSLKESVKKAGRQGYVNDPNYPNHKVKVGQVRDHFYDTSLHPMYWEEMRHLKRRHIQYGRMSLPEDLDLPARTIMATANSSSRESLILETGRTVEYQGRRRKVYRQPTVREVACIQGFPLDFQLAARTLNDRYKLIGNAVPCQLSFALAKAMLKDMGSRPSSDDKEFRSRMDESLRRLVENGGLPIVTRPKVTVDEAEDIGRVHIEFNARERKHIRRKLLSSKLEDDSSIVIFENAVLEDGRTRGGAEWKACIQRGMGGTFHRVYIDEVSVGSILRSMSSTLDSGDLRRLVASLLREVDRGIPVLTDAWEEFPGYTVVIREPSKMVSKRRLKLPGCSLLQKAFTTDMPDLGRIAGPVDLFDGLDAIMLSTFTSKDFADMRQRNLYIRKMEDTGDYPHRLDPRIVPRIEDAEMPLVTLSSALMSIHVLTRMYGSDEVRADSTYARSVSALDDRIVKWTSE